LLTRTTAFGYFPHNLIGLNQRLTDHLPNPPNGRPREKLWQVRARSVVLATGAIERPLVFPGNDRPGILLAGAAHTYLNRYGVRVGRRAVIVTSGDDAYQAALNLQAAGVTIAAIADLRAEASGALPDAARRAGIDVLPGSTVLGTEGDLRVNSITLGRVQGGAVQAGQRIPCDTVLMSGGYTPSVHLFLNRAASCSGTRCSRPSCPERRRNASAPPVPAAESTIWPRYWRMAQRPAPPRLPSPVTRGAATR
jgi:sarcosine oxidase subunit alpha